MAKQKPYQQPQPKKPQTQQSSKKEVPLMQAQYSGAGKASGDIVTRNLPLLAILAITFIAFAPSLNHEFVNWDDDVNILTNAVLKRDFSFQQIIDIFQQNVIGAYNPLTIFTFAIEKALFGMKDLPYYVHLNNILLHLGCVYFVYRIGQEMGLSKWSTVLLTALFAIHPMRVESVVWATERKDVLFGIFFLASCWRYVKYLKSEHYTGLKNKYLIQTLILFAIGLFAKIQMVTLPLSLLAFDYYYKRPLKFNLILEKWVFWLGSLAIGLVNVFSLISFKTIGTTKVDYSILDRLCIGAYAFVVYVGKLIFPWRMLPLYPYEAKLPTEVYAAPLGFFVAAGLLWWAYKQNWRVVVFGWVFFFVNFIFVSQIVGAGQAYIADRFTYISYFGGFFILVKLMEGHLAKTSIKAAFIVYLILCFSMTYTQVGIWKNSETLWTHELQYYKNAAVPWNNRGIYYRESGQNDKAIADFNESIKLAPNAAAYNSRGKVYFETKKYAEAMSDYTNAIKIEPKLAEAYANRAAVYGTINNVEAAIKDINIALELEPKNINALVNRGTAYLATKQYDLAIRDLSKVIELEPNHQNAHLNRSLVYKGLGQHEKALADAVKYVNINPKNAGMWMECALAKRKLNRCAEAMKDYEEALKIDGRFGDAYLERAKCHIALGNRGAAKADAQTAKQLGVPVDPALLQ
jgi:protein O-mannosyl-transferase